jgi:hypothetical protein
MAPNLWVDLRELGQGLRWPNFSTWARLPQVHFYRSNWVSLESKGFIF